LYLGALDLFLRCSTVGVKKARKKAVMDSKGDGDDKILS
jgi:hypothetical protein